MDLRIICRFLGKISLAEAAVTAIPLTLALMYQEEA